MGRIHRAAYRAKVVCDPWQAIAMVQRLRSRGLQVEEFTFSQQSVGRLAVGLHNVIRDHRLALPDDPELVDELVNVRLRETAPNVYRLDHDPDRHDDRAVALAMGVTTLATVPRPGGPVIFSDEDNMRQDLAEAGAPARSPKLSRLSVAAPSAATPRCQTPFIARTRTRPPRRCAAKQ